MHRVNGKAGHGQWTLALTQTKTGVSIQSTGMACGGLLAVLLQ